MTAVNYKGTWDASGTTPPGSPFIPTQGDYYVVSKSGNQSLTSSATASISSWLVGDWVVYDGAFWERIIGSANTFYGDHLHDDTGAINALLNAGHYAPLPIPASGYYMAAGAASGVSIPDGAILEGQGAPSYNNGVGGVVVPVLLPTGNISRTVYSLDTKGIGIRNLMINMAGVMPLAASTITGITNTGSGTGGAQVTTSSVHGLAPGDVVFISGVVGMYETQMSISALAWAGGIATATTSGNHGFRNGDQVDIAGASLAGYDGYSLVVTVVSATVFTYSVVTNPGGTATGATVYQSIVNNKHFVVYTAAPGSSVFTLKGTDFTQVGGLPTAFTTPGAGMPTPTVQQRPCGLVLDGCWFFNIENVSVINVQPNCIGICLIGSDRGTYWGNLANTQVLNTAANGTGYVLQGSPHSPADAQAMRGTSRVNQVSFANCRAYYNVDGWIVDECGGGLAMTSCTAEYCSTDGMRIQSHSSDVYPVVSGGEYSNNGRYGINGGCQIFNSPMANNTLLPMANNAVWMRLMDDGTVSFPATMQLGGLVNSYAQQALVATDTIVPVATIMRVRGATAAVTLTSTTQIQPALNSGQLLFLMGADNVHAVTLLTNNNTVTMGLTGLNLRSNALTLGVGQWVMLMYMNNTGTSIDNTWVEITRSNCLSDGVLLSPGSPILQPWQNEVYMSTGTAPRSCSLPSAASATGQEYFVMQVSGTGVATVLPTGSAHINGASSYVIPTSNYSYVKFRSDGSNWYVSGSGSTGAIVSSSSSVALQPWQTQVYMNAGTSVLTCTLPTAANGLGREYFVKLASAGAGGMVSVTTADSSPIIDGFATYTLINAQYKFAKFVTDGTVWWVSGAG